LKLVETLESRGLLGLDLDHYLTAAEPSSACWLEGLSSGVRCGSCDCPRPFRACIRSAVSRCFCNSLVWSAKRTFS